MAYQHARVVTELAIGMMQVKGDFFSATCSVIGT
jgi:hypothetical protein